MPRGKYTDAEIIDMAIMPDITTVEGKDPNRFYYHARKDPLRVQQLKRQGFKVEEADDGTVPSSPGALQDDGTSLPINIPGHILMSRDKDLNDKIVKARRSRFESLRSQEEEAALEQAQESFKKLGIKARIRRRLSDIE